MPTSLEYFRLVAPEFSDELVVSVNSFIELAAAFIDPAIFANAELALAYQAASLMYQQKQSAGGVSNGMAITMEKEGDLARQYRSSNTGINKDIYMQALDKLAVQFIGSSIMTRYGV